MQIRVNTMVNGLKDVRREKGCISIPIRIYFQATG